MIYILSTPFLLCCVFNQLFKTSFWNFYECLQEYVVEDVDGEMSGSEWTPPPLPTEHIAQLKSLGLL